jgi:DNA polymerase V
MDLGGCSAGEPFALQVIDNSMEPEFKKGNIIIIDPTGLATDGAYVLAMVENGYIFRQLVIENNQHFIQPLHEDYQHEKCEISLDAIHGVIVQQTGPNGRRKDRKRYD